MINEVNSQERVPLQILNLTNQLNIPLSKGETTWKKAFSFIQMADCQLGFFENDQSWEKEKELLSQTVEKINELKPRFVILCGDLTNARPFAPQYPAQVKDYKSIIFKISADIPL